MKVKSSALCASIVSAFLIGNMPTAASANDDVSQLIAREPFGSFWPLPEEFSMPRLQQLLQNMSDSIYEKGFKVIGNERDFFHGHILWTADELTKEGRLKPFAILYHTQEEAYSAHWKTKRSTSDEVADPSFDYIDVRARNWIQWLDRDSVTDGTRIENARIYVNAAKKNPEVFFGENTPKEGEHFTIHARWLDPAKLGVKIVGEVQWDFHAVPCTGKQGPASYYERGPVQVKLRTSVAGNDANRDAERSSDEQVSCLMIKALPASFFQH